METTLANVGWRLLQDDRGQDLIEYALISSLIALVCALQIQCLGMSVDRTYDGIDATVDSIPS